jgi:hypothetical protein
MKRTAFGLCALILSGCGGGTVSENSARTAYEKSTPAIVEGKAKLVSFRKINAQKSELFGVKMYDVEYEAELKFLEDVPPEVWDVTGFPSKGFGPKTVRVEAQTKEDAIAKGTKLLPEDRRNKITADKPGFPPHVSGPKGKKDEITKVSGRLHFEQTEKGWRGPDRNVY